MFNLPLSEVNAMGLFISNSDCVSLEPSHLPARRHSLTGGFFQLQIEEWRANAVRVVNDGAERRSIENSALNREMEQRHVFGR